MRFLYTLLLVFSFNTFVLAQTPTAQDTSSSKILKILVKAEEIIGIYNSVVTPELMDEISNFQSTTSINVYAKPKLNDTTIFARVLNGLVNVKYQQLQAPYIVFEIGLEKHGVPAPDETQSYTATLDIIGSPELSQTAQLLDEIAEELNELLKDAFKVEEGETIAQALIRALKKFKGVDELEIHVPYVVNFSKNNNNANTFGFDNAFIEDFINEYESVSINKDDYNVAWKSVKTNQPDNFIIKLLATGDTTVVGFNTDSIKFRNGLTNTDITPTINGDNTILTIQGGASEGENQIYAYYELQNQDKETQEVKIGQINIQTYEDNTPIEVVMVPVNGCTTPDKFAIQNYLNQTYKKAVASFNVSLLSNLQVNDVAGGFNETDSDNAMNYSPDMETVINNLKDHPDYDNEKYYLFFIDNSQGTMGGYMPFKRQYGFIFPSGENLGGARTIAHELGHGVYRLRHTFDDYSGIASGSTDNLMDYSTDNNLWKYQWDYIHDPEVTINWLHDESEGEAPAVTPSDNINRLVELIRCAFKDNSTFSFPTPCDIRDVYLEEVELHNGNTYRIRVIFKKDVVNLQPQRIYPQYGNGYYNYYFDGFEIAVKADQNETFESYLFPNNNIWNNQLQNRATLIEDKILAGNIDDVFDLLYESSHCVISKLSYISKFKLLKSISEENYQEDFFDYIVVDLLTSISKSDTESASFYNDIENNSGIITHLYNGTDDEFTHDKFINNLILIFSNYWKDKIIDVSEEKHFVRSATTAVVHSGSTEISFIKWKIDSYGSRVWSNPINFSPLEPLGLIKPSTEVGKEDVIIYVPAIYLRYFESNCAKNDAIEFLGGAAMIAGVFSGTSLIIRGPSAIQKIIGFIELANVATTVVLEDENIRNMISSTPEGISFLENWPKISNGLDYATISVDLLRSFAKNGSKVLDDFHSTIPELERQRIRMVINKCDNVVNGVGKLGTLIDDAVTVVAKNENLPNWIKQSFKDGSYVTVQTNKKIIIFRDFGDKAFMDGSFSTTINNATRNELALHESFENSMRFKSTIEAPIGEVLDIGKVGPYPPGTPNALPGGADQILLPENYNHSWIKEIVDSQTGQTYTVGAFKQAFPNLIKNL